MFFYREAQTGLDDKWENCCQLPSVFGGLAGHLLPMLLMPCLVCTCNITRVRRSPHKGYDFSSLVDERKIYFTPPHLMT